MKIVPTSDFTAVIDIERNVVFETGRYSDMKDLAASLNEHYQIQAYVAKRMYPEVKP